MHSHSHTGAVYQHSCASHAHTLRQHTHACSNTHSATATHTHTSINAIVEAANSKRAQCNKQTVKAASNSCQVIGMAIMGTTHMRTHSGARVWGPLGGSPLAAESRSSTHTRHARTPLTHASQHEGDGCTPQAMRWRMRTHAHRPDQACVGLSCGRHQPPTSAFTPSHLRAWARPA
jgi:hypothetical protein